MAHINNSYIAYSVSKHIAEEMQADTRANIVTLIIDQLIKLALVSKIYPMHIKTIVEDCMRALMINAGSGGDNYGK